MSKKYLTKRLQQAIGTEEDDLEDISRELENSGVDLERFDDPNIELAEYEGNFFKEKK